MVRAVFFVAASTYASPATTLPSVTRTGAGVPVLLLGGLGVIHRPLTGGDRFRHVDEVVDLFAQLDTDDSLVEFEDVWLPVAWLADQNPPERSHPHFHHFAGRGRVGVHSVPRRLDRRRLLVHLRTIAQRWLRSWGRSGGDITDTQPRVETVRSADGTEIGLHIIGSGPPLVIVHGAWNWAEHWLGVAEALADAHACLVMDRRARGTSGDGVDYSFDREIEDVAAVLDTAGPDVSLLGHSSGAIYALETARRVGVGRLILYEPPLRWAERGDPAGLVDRVSGHVDAGRLEEAARVFFSEEGRLPDEALQFLRSRPEWDSMVALAPTCVREWEAILDAGISVDRYRELSIPTLLLAGSENLDHPSMATDPLAATLPDVRTAVLDGHGHMANRTDPTLVAEKVRGFLAATAS